jgi:excisionase family DNA binding protein
MQDVVADSVANSRLYYRVREVARLTGLGLRTIYEGVYAGWIPSRKIGNSRLIPAAWVHATTDREADAIASANMPKYQYTLATRPRTRADVLRLLQALLRASLHLLQRPCLAP